MDQRFPNGLTTNGRRPRPTALVDDAARPDLRGRLRALVAGDERVDLVDAGPADVLVWDAGPRVDKARARALLESADATWLIAVYADGDVHVARRAFEVGASGAIEESGVEQSLVPAILLVRARLLAFPSDLRLDVLPPSLSHRERQALELLLEGRTNAEIAERLFLSESTVKSHLSSSFAKLGVRSRRDAAAVLRRTRLLHGAGEPDGPWF